MVEKFIDRQVSEIQSTILHQISRVDFIEGITNTNVMGERPEENVFKSFNLKESDRVYELTFEGLSNGWEDVTTKITALEKWENRLFHPKVDFMKVMEISLNGYRPRADVDDSYTHSFTIRLIVVLKE